MQNFKRFKELSDWIEIDGYCATRIRLGEDANNSLGRVTFIEKTPRVRVSSNQCGVCEIINGKERCYGADGDVWLSGFDNGEYGYDSEINTFNEQSCKWCDDMLSLLGYE